MKVKILKFCFYHMLYKGSEVMVGSGDSLRKKKKKKKEKKKGKKSQREYLFKRGQVEDILTVAN